MSNSHIFHISHNLLLIHQFYNNFSFSKYLKKKLKNYKKKAFKTSTMTSITFVLSFHKPKCLLITFFIPYKK